MILRQRVLCQHEFLKRKINKSVTAYTVWPQTVQFVSGLKVVQIVPLWIVFIMNYHLLAHGYVMCIVKFLPV